MKLLIIGTAVLAGAILLLAATSPPKSLPNDWSDRTRSMRDVQIEVFLPYSHQHSAIEFLILYVHAFALFVASYQQRARVSLQTALFSIRQIMMTTLFGRGLLHG